ncbi:hypothetical protein CMK18_08525 [Candidatus Poribacteria bacterium]|nr:hypothetical protein [Candidatus Poribacteria bacterium]
MINFEIIKGHGDDIFCSYMLRSPHSLIYSKPSFLGLVASHLGASPHWVVARKNGEIIGLLPYLVKMGALGPAYNSLAYYGSNGGVIQDNDNDEIKVELIREFYFQAERAGAVSATIISNPLLKDAHLYEETSKYDYRDERIGQITHLPRLDDVGDLIKLFDNPRPRNIRRAMKEGISVNKGRSESLDFLYETHINNMMSIGGLPKRRSFFDNISKYMEDHEWVVFTAVLDRKPIAALLLFYFNKTVEYFTPVIHVDYRKTQALSFVIYSAMQDAISHGYENWNWGGTWLSQDGVYNFKKKWAATDYPYYYYTRVYKQDLLECTPNFLIENYQGFFLIPFRELTKIQEYK